MSKASETLLALANFNSWRRGDETLEMPPPEEIGAAIDDAVNLLRRYDEMERRLVRIAHHIEDSNYYGGFAAPRGAAKVLHEVLALANTPTEGTRQ